TKPAFLRKGRGWRGFWLGRARVIGRLWRGIVRRLGGWGLGRWTADCFFWGWGSGFFSENRKTYMNNYLSSARFRQSAKGNESVFEAAISDRGRVLFSAPFRRL